MKHPLWDLTVHVWKYPSTPRFDHPGVRHYDTSSKGIESLRANTDAAATRELQGANVESTSGETDRWVNAPFEYHF